MSQPHFWAETCGDFSLFHAAESSAGEINRLRIDAVTEKKRAAHPPPFKLPGPNAPPRP